MKVRTSAAMSFAIWPLLPLYLMGTESFVVCAVFPVEET